MSPQLPYTLAPLLALPLLALPGCRFDASTEQLPAADASLPGVTPGQVDADMSGVDGGREPDAIAALCFEPMADVQAERKSDGGEGCTDWPSLSEMEGKAVVTRTGEALTLDFGEGIVFSGTVLSGVASLTYSHQHSLSDGCSWTAVEELSGNVDDIACTAALDYSYVESASNQVGCFNPCTFPGSASIGIKLAELD